jgi:toxin ParE1/3/4
LRRKGADGWPKAKAADEDRQIRRGRRRRLKQNTDKALVSIRGICDLLAEHPELGELQPDLLPKLRRFTIENFAVFYRPLTEGVEVLMVLHAARDSAKALRERLP